MIVLQTSSLNTKQNTNLDVTHVMRRKWKEGKLFILPCLLMQDRKLGDRIEKQVRLQLERENSEAIVDWSS